MRLAGGLAYPPVPVMRTRRRRHDYICLSRRRIASVVSPNDCATSVDENSPSFLHPLLYRLAPPSPSDPSPITISLFGRSLSFTFASRRVELAAALTLHCTDIIAL
ncbi:uncharacterized protein [Physcomitrium patens]|uniref:uncharacterized protein n=1 Tax=Physcomitrium patens TaxID=3218 RepID=UPI003CCDED8F